MDFLSLPVIGLIWLRWQEENRRYQEEVDRLVGSRSRSRRPVRQNETSIRCATCGSRLGSDLEDDPTGDAGLPICGECDRARNFDVLLETDALLEADEVEGDY